MTDADIDALLARGDHEAAARAAAELVDPGAYGAAMIRAFAVAKQCRQCGPATNYSHEPRQETR